MTFSSVLLFTLIAVLTLTPGIALMLWVIKKLQTHAGQAEADANYNDSDNTTAGTHVKQAAPSQSYFHHLFIAGSIFCLLGSIASAGYTVYFLSNSIQTTATITEIKEQENSEGKTIYTLIYAYADDAEKTYTARSSTGNNSQYKVGDTLQIRYFTDHPPHSRIDSATHHWSLTYIAALGSVMLFLAPVIYRWWHRA